MSMEDHKFDTLKTLYIQQQSTATVLRDRIEKITTATIGLFVVMNGWIISNRPNLTGSHTVMLIAAIIVITGVAIYGVRARFKEFSTVGRMIVRIETAMNLYEPGAFIKDEPLYPLEHMNFGKEDYEHGLNIYRSRAYILIIFSLLSIGLSLYS